MALSHNEGRSKLGTKREIRPGVWEIGVSCGYREDGTRRYSWRRVHGNEVQADAAMLRRYLDETGMKPAELAAKLGTSRSSIGNLMQGNTREPSLHKAYAIARVLGISLDEMARLLYEDDGENEE